MDEIVQEGVEDGGVVTEEFSVDMEAFRGSLPEEVRDAEIIKNAKDVGSIAKMAVDNNRMVGQRFEDLINAISQNGTNPQVADEIYSKLGWPGADGKYEVTRPETTDGVGYNEDVEAKFLEAAKDLRLNTTQVNGILAMQNEMMKEQLAVNVEQAETANNQLKTDWGDKYEGNKNEVKALLEKFGDDSLIKLFNETELGSHTGFIKLIHSLGAGMIEKGAVGRGDAALQSVLHKDEAQAKIAGMYTNTETADILADPNHPDHQVKQQELQKLFDIVHGTKPID